MRFVFGHNHFKIRSYDPYELGLTQKPVSDFSIEVRQRYFHLFRVPFFGLGKTWNIRKKDQLFELPADYKAAIDGRSDLHVHTPWHTYAGPLLLTLIGLCYVVNSKYISWENHLSVKKEYAAMAADNISKFRKPSPDDYYIMTAADGTEKYAHITELDKQHIQLSYINNTGVRAEKPGEMAGLFTSYASELGTITISRADSSRLICNEYEKRHSFTGIPLNNEDGKTYRVEKIIRIEL